MIIARISQIEWEYFVFHRVDFFAIQLNHVLIDKKLSFCYKNLKIFAGSNYFILTLGSSTP